jgi:DNA modification methylase
VLRGSELTPYYEQDGITIYHGDCREMLPTLRAHALVTDPPFGIALGNGDKRPNHGLAKRGYGLYDDTLKAFRETVVPGIRGALDVTDRGAVFMAGKRLWELPMAAAVGGVFCPSAMGRNPWGFASLWPVAFYGVAPDQNAGACRAIVLRSTDVAEQSDHPCPKPVRWMTWLVSLASRVGETVLDPFMGSGTTLVAAKNLGRRAIGIEIEERYCEIAAKRLAQGVLDLSA